MAIIHRNAAYKVKVGSAPTTLGFLPEAGAMLFNTDLGILFSADGFNWNPLGPGGPIDSLATRLNAPLVVALAAATPLKVTFFDTIIYNTGGSYTPDLVLQQILFNITGNYQVNSGYEVSADQNNVVFASRMVINGVPGNAEVTTLGSKNTPYTLYGSDGVPFTAGDIVTVEFETSIACNLTYGNLSIGVQSIV